MQFKLNSINCMHSHNSLTFRRANKIFRPHGTFQLGIFSKGLNASLEQCNFRLKYFPSPPFLINILHLRIPFLVTRPMCKTNKRGEKIHTSRATFSRSRGNKSAIDGEKIVGRRVTSFIGPAMAEARRRFNPTARRSLCSQYSNAGVSIGRVAIFVLAQGNPSSPLELRAGL